MENPTSQNAKQLGKRNDLETLSENNIDRNEQ